LARPINKWHYERPDWALLAAAYLCGFAQKQGFVDGNKRTGLVAALTFLQGNGVTVDVPLEELYALTLLVARNEIGEEAVASWFRTRVS
jgi:death on curing protein